MNLIQQPWDSKLCGHCCVAMVAGVSLAKVIGAIGHLEGTKTKEIVSALEAFGVGVKKLKVGKPPKGALSIVKAWPINQKKSRGWHWVVIDQRGKMLDPSSGNLSHILYNERYKLTSYLEIKQTENHHEASISNEKAQPAGVLR